MERPLLTILQRGLPLTPRPFETLAKDFHLTEEQLLDKISNAFAEGKFRRLGAVFDANSLNYRSTLCAIDRIPETQFEKVLSLLKSYPNITHIYRRGWIEELPKEHFGYLADAYPEVWFTWSDASPVFEKELSMLKACVKPAVIYELPALLRFKIQVIFGQEKEYQPPKASTIILNPTERQKSLIRHLQGNVTLCPNLYAVIAQACSWTEEEVISQIQQWINDGVIRRFTIIPKHQKIGFKANAMGLWNVSREEAEHLGPILAKNPEVTHCYFRQTFPGFPYGLYAMIHGKEWCDLLVIFERLSEQIKCTQGKMLCSLNEYKKTSMLYFIEPQERNK